MALSRKYQKIFGKNAQGTDLAIVGSKSQSNPQYSSDVEEIQSLSNWETGLRAQVTSSDAPYLQDQNAIFYVITSQLAYLFQAGIAEWNSQTEYIANRSLVLKSGKVYFAIANNTNVEPEVTSGWETYWQNLLSWSKIVGNIYNQTDLWNILTKGMWYNSAIASAIGGYPQGTILNYTDTYGNIIQIKSLVNNNTDEPSSSNIKTPINSGATKWEIVSTKMSELFLVNPNATTQSPVYNGYVRISLNNSGYFRLGNVKGLYFGDQSVGIDVTPNTMNINATTFTVFGNPIVRTPDYSNRTTLADSDQSKTLTIANDGWLLLKTRVNNAYVTIGGYGIINEGDSRNGELVSMMIPIKAGDVVSTRNTVVYFYPYR